MFPSWHITVFEKISFGFGVSSLFSAQPLVMSDSMGTVLMGLDKPDWFLATLQWISFLPWHLLGRALFVHMRTNHSADQPQPQTSCIHSLCHIPGLTYFCFAFVPPNSGSYMAFDWSSGSHTFTDEPLTRLSRHAMDASATELMNFGPHAPLQFHSFLFDWLVFVNVRQNNLQNLDLLSYLLWKCPCFCL